MLLSPQQSNTVVIWEGKSHALYAQKYPIYFFDHCEAKGSCVCAAGGVPYKSSPVDIPRMDNAQLCFKWIQDLVEREIGVQAGGFMRHSNQVL